MMDLVIFGLVANKSDLSDWEVSEEEGRKYADENGLYFGITSAKTGEGVKFFFDSIIYISLIINTSQLQRIINLEQEENYDDNEFIDKEIYCGKCKLIPSITLSKHLNINIKCGCGERKDVLIGQYINSLPSIYASLELNRKCFNHPDEIGIIFCYDCKKSLCKECLEDHDKDHNLLIEYRSNLQKECDYHKHKRIRYYSEENKINRCFICFITLNKTIHTTNQTPLQEKTKETFVELVSVNNYKESIDTANTIIKTLEEEYNVTKKKKYLIKIFTIKNIIEEYKLRYPYLIKLYKIMLRMKQNKKINHLFTIFILNYLQQFYTQIVKEQSYYDSIIRSFQKF